MSIPAAPTRSELKNRTFIGGIGVSIPEASISNDELVASYNAWVESENIKRAAQGGAAVRESSSDFIVNASGIRNRHVYERDGILDPGRMAPRIPGREDHELSVLAEFGLGAAKRALDDAGVDAAQLDLVICSNSHPQRPYPALAIEIQQALGAGGAAFDMGLGCSSALAALHVATNLVRAGAHQRILVVVPELVTSHLDFRDRQTHFIFGDAAVAFLVEGLGEKEERAGRFEIIGTSLWTQFSSNIRTNFGHLSRLAQDDPSVLHMEGNLIKQVGNKVFKEVTVAGHQFIVDFLAGFDHTPATMRPVLAASGECADERHDPQTGLWGRSRTRSGSHGT